MIDSGHRVALADNDASMRQLVRDALECGGFTVCGEAANASDAVRLVSDSEPDVALLEINMPGNGIRAAGYIRAARPETAVVILTASREMRICSTRSVRAYRATY
jgi:DNA-binding NarL/FixJ family response regulator